MSTAPTQVALLLFVERNFEIVGHVEIGGSQLGWQRVIDNVTHIHSPF